MVGRRAFSDGSQNGESRPMPEILPGYNKNHLAVKYPVTVFLTK